MKRALHALIGVSVAASGLAAAHASENSIEVLPRVGKWVLRYDRDACHLIAQFGQGGKMVTARFTRYRPSDGFDLDLFGERFRASDTESEVKLDFGQSGGPFGARAVNGSAGKLKAVFLGSVRIDGWRAQKEGEDGPPVTAAQEASVAGLTVTVDRKRTFRLELGSLAKPLAQMRTCTTDLVKSWGYDPDVQAALSREVTPVNSPGRWLRADDYPTGALASGMNGMVQFRLDVDAEGEIAGCHVLARTSPDVFADLTCSTLTKRAKLLPALDAQGKPVRSYWVQKVYWKIAR